MKEKLSKWVLNVDACLKTILCGLVSMITTFIWTILWLPMAIVFSLNDSYFPEKKRKSLIRRIFENVLWDLIYHRSNGFYNLYGLDIIGSVPKDYIDEKSFWNKLDKLNKKCSIGGYSQICLLRDKYLFYEFMSKNDLPVPEVFAVIKKGKLYTNRLDEISFDTLKNEKEYFMKDIDGECASFVKKIKDYEHLKVLLKMKIKGTYILQRKIEQCKEFNEFNSKSINTLRVVTVNIDGNVEVLTSLFRVGTNKSGNVDNWAAGGLAIGIKNDGYLKKYGFYKPHFGLKTDKHPDSNIIFDSFQIPMLNEAYELAKEAHKYFYTVGAIGWDIAITDEGPVFIEGNDNFEITLMQACDRPLKKEIKKL